MLSRQKNSKGITGLVCYAGECSISGETSKKDINLVSSSGHGSRQTFTVKNAPKKKFDLMTTAENMKMKSVSTRKNQVDIKEKGKLNEDGYNRAKNTRKSRRLLLEEDQDILLLTRLNKFGERKDQMNKLLQMMNNDEQ